MSTIVPEVQSPEHSPSSSSESPGDCAEPSFGWTLSQLSSHGGLKLTQLGPRPLPRQEPLSMLAPPLPKSIRGMGLRALRDSRQARRVLSAALVRWLRDGGGAVVAGRTRWIRWARCPCRPTSPGWRAECRCSSAAAGRCGRTPADAAACTPRSGAGWRDKSGTGSRPRLRPRRVFVSAHRGWEERGGCGAHG